MEYLDMRESLANHNEKKRYIGVDLGPTSNGVAILDENMRLVRPIIIHRFKDACDMKTGESNNKSRRTYRLGRRMLQRRKNRRNDFLKLLLSSNTIQNEAEWFDAINNVVSVPYQLKLIGLKEKLPKKDLIFCLQHYLKHRGFKYLKDDSVILSNSDDKSKLPSEIQKKCCEAHGFIHGNVINSSFSRSQWQSEIEQFLSKQNVSNEFKQKYMEIFNRSRSYAYGPGNKETKSMYGLCYENAHSDHIATL
jgi:CRISPR-associated endonuclease Csn1